MVVWGNNKGSGVVVEGSVEGQPRWSLEKPTPRAREGIGESGRTLAGG